ncbi:hypothetical protein YC2023_019674 [Brassica napus]
MKHLNLLMAPLVISSFQSQLLPPSRLRTLSPPPVSTPPSVSFVSTPPSDSESRLHPLTPLIRLSNPSPPSRLRPASHLSRLRPASPPSQLQVRPPPDPPPCTYPPVLPEARSPPKPPEPPDVPFNLVLLLIDGVISLVYVDDTCFVSKCLSPAYAVPLLRYVVPLLQYAVLSLRHVEIVDCALVAASILGFISLIVVTNFQGFILLYSSMVAEIRGLLDITSCLSVLYAPIFLCCICFLVIAVCLPWMASSSCTHTFSIYGE